MSKDTIHIRNVRDVVNHISYLRVSLQTSTVHINLYTFTLALSPLITNSNMPTKPKTVTMLH